MRIINKSKTLDISGCHNKYFMIPCGQCSECLQAKTNEYALRCHYEYKRCLDKGGYCYFETLTYAPEYLPTIGKVLYEDKMTLRKLKSGRLVFRKVNTDHKKYDFFKDSDFVFSDDP